MKAFYVAGNLPTHRALFSRVYIGCVGWSIFGRRDGRPAIGCHAIQ